MHRPPSFTTRAHSKPLRNLNILFMTYRLTPLLILVLCLAIGCRKTSNGLSGGGTGTGTGTGTGGGTTTPTDPSTAATIGFFMDDWTPKSFVLPSYTDTTMPATAANSVTIDASNIITKISPSVFGQNGNIWSSQMANEPVLVNHLSNLKSHLIRFPGGSISDIYFWNATPGTPPADAPDSLPDANGTLLPSGYWFGKNTASWTESLDNYYTLLGSTGNQGLITINYGYARYGKSANPVAAAAHLAADWVRYDNGRTKYWEIGNESNGNWEAGYRIRTALNRDGQPEIITGALYGQHFKVFADSMKKAAQQIGKTIYIGGYLLEKQPESWQTATDQTWNDGVIRQIGNVADYYIIHSYYTPYQQNSSADVILNTAVSNTSAMMNYVKTSLTFAGVPVKPVALTEWNITSQGSMQQVSFVNGMHAAILVGESIKNQYGETSRWDLANAWESGNDHGLFNTGDEPGVARWNPRPAFYYLYYFQRMSGDRLLSASVQGDFLAYASSFSSGEKGVVLVNKNVSAQAVQINLQHATPGTRFYWYTLTGGTDNGEFSRKVYVNGRGPSELSGGPSQQYTTLNAYSAPTQNGMRITLPARSVVYVVIDK